MRFLKNFLLGLASVIVLLLIIALFLPSSSHVERSRVINAPAAVIFEEMNDLKNWEHWSPWMQDDPQMELSYGANTVGVGGTYSWKSKSQGNGSMTITESKPFEKVVTRLNFEGMGEPVATYSMEPAEGGTKVTWSLDSKYHWNIIMRWFGVLFKGFINESYDRGLKNLDAYILAHPKAEVKPEITSSLAVMESTFKARKFLSIRKKDVPFSDIPKFIQQSLGEITVYTATKDANNTGMPFAIYHQYAGDIVDIEVCYGVDKDLANNKDVKFTKWNDKKVVMTNYYGSYETISKAHDAIKTWAVEHQTILDKMALEEYVTDPGVVTNPDSVLTKVYFFVKK